MKKNDILGSIVIALCVGFYYLVLIVYFFRYPRTARMRLDEFLDDDVIGTPVK